VKNLKSDASVERLLADTLEARVEPAPEGACLDAETLAAWADDTLDAHERAAAEAHAADCGRCQALLAAMVKTMPVLTARQSAWRMPALGWMVPLTAAAAALAVWVLVPKQATVEQRSSPAAPVDQLEPAPAASALVTPPPDAQPQGRVAEDQRAAAAAALEAAAPVREQQGRAALEKNANAAPPPRANALAETVIVGGATPSPRPGAESIAPRDTSAAAKMLAQSPAPGTIIVSSNPATRFRLLFGGGVQRTADGGSTWRTEITGATETLAAGASPSPSVCWLVGPGGTVLLSTDGRTWRRLAFPEALDLRSVSATDDQIATVTAADGRSFVTADGGETWSLAPGN